MAREARGGERLRAQADESRAGGRIRARAVAHAPCAEPGRVLLQPRVGERSARREPDPRADLGRVSLERHELEVEARLAGELRAPRGERLRERHVQRVVRELRPGEQAPLAALARRLAGHDVERRHGEIGRDPVLGWEVLRDASILPDLRQISQASPLDQRRPALDGPGSSPQGRRAGRSRSVASGRGRDRARALDLVRALRAGRAPSSASARGRRNEEPAHGRPILPQPRGVCTPGSPA
jgi:hypothetical protein